MQSTFFECKVSVPDYEQTPSSHSKKTVVIKTVETKDGEVQMFLLKHIT